MSKVFSHLSPEFQTVQLPNGALLYSQEIVKYFIPAIKTKRNWVTIRKVPFAYDHSIVFIHNNLNPSFYDYLKNYKDLVLVCGIPETCEKVKHLGTTIYLPLSVNVKEVEKFKTKKIYDSCYAGRRGKFASCNVPYSTPHLQDMEHNELLAEMAKYKKVYAVGRTAIEAKILGCKLLKYDPRFPDTNIWNIVDTSDAIEILQNKLDSIDNKTTINFNSDKPIIDTLNPKYLDKRYKLGAGKYNGAYYYSKEIVKNIIPMVKTNRPWDTLGMESVGTYNNAIVFIHHNINMDKVYAWLKNYKNLVLVVSTPYTYEWAVNVGYKTIYLPLSIDTEYVKQFKTKKTKDTCFCGNIWSFRKEEIANTIPKSVDFQPKDITREELLKFMSPYKKVYAIGRCALEAKCLGAEILQCYKKFPVDHWKLLDNKEAGEILQRELDKIDGKTR